MSKASSSLHYNIQIGESAQTPSSMLISKMQVCKCMFFMYTQVVNLIMLHISKKTPQNIISPNRFSSAQESTTRIVPLDLCTPALETLPEGIPSKLAGSSKSLDIPRLGQLLTSSRERFTRRDPGVSGISTLALDLSPLGVNIPPSPMTMSLAPPSVSESSSVLYSSANLAK